MRRGGTVIATPGSAARGKRRGDPWERMADDVPDCVVPFARTENRRASHCDGQRPELLSGRLPPGLTSLAARWGVAKR
jgi:hypothetical protein